MAFIVTDRATAPLAKSLARAEHLHRVSAPLRRFGPPALEAP